MNSPTEAPGARSNAARAMRRLWIAAAACILVPLMPVMARAQQGASPMTIPALLVRADSAYDDGDRERARLLYREVLARDGSQSRAVFRLAQLEPAPATALAWYRRYTELEPDDAWGHMAYGDQLGRLGRWGAGLDAYTRAAALAPDERDVAIGRARLLDRAGRPTEAAAVLQGWTARHDDDGEAWDLRGRSANRAGRPRAAAEAFERAARLGIRGAADREATARAQAAPAAEPVVGVQRDSDGNSTTRVGALVDVMLADGVRMGGGVQRLTIGDDFDEVSGTDVAASLSARPAAAARIEVRGGAVLFGEPRLGGASWTAPQGEARLRLRAPQAGPSFELRAQHGPVGYSPVLVGNRVTRTEVRATGELPLGPLRVRGTGRAGQVEATGETANARTGYDAALVLPLRGQAQLSGQYRVLGFQRGSLAGYFAPRRAETMEGGLYFEAEGEGPLSLAADLGAGAQRVAEQGANVGRWTRALRGWGYASLALGPARALYVEAEAYDAPFAPEGIATAGNWRFLAVSVGLRWALR